MQSLFDNDPAFNVRQITMRSSMTRVRNRLGQFCTEEQKRTENIMHENMLLRRKADTYFRNWQATAKRLSYLERENTEIKNVLSGLLEKQQKL